MVAVSVLVAGTVGRIGAFELASGVTLRKGVAKGVDAATIEKSSKQRWLHLPHTRSGHGSGAQRCYVTRRDATNFFIEKEIADAKAQV